MIWYLNSKLDLNLLRQGLLEPEFYGDLVYKLKKIVGSCNFSAQFIEIISHYKKIGYNINVLEEKTFYLYKQHRLMKCSIMLPFIWVLTVCKSTCLVVSPNTRG